MSKYAEYDLETQLHLIIKDLRVQSGSAAGMMVCSSEDREQIVKAVMDVIPQVRAQALEDAAAWISPDSSGGGTISDWLRSRAETERAAV